ncbi:hypothetical protein DPMN_127977 [Dreissena polymorpha]|uniref:Fibronectin type-III domain-containing protein n=1 Tax=Dreissena polymorpha TaxID=45954 RepID=A0A9D4JVB4_DREPO|nr:hypothetical protein DPMN_127977 [Dreissena polymorpha]
MAMCKLFLQIKCLSEDGQHNCSRSVNGSTHSLRLENLVAGMNYNIEMAAVTSQGTGKWSSVFAIGPDNSGITKEPWFIGMIGALGGIVWLGLCIFTVWLCRNRQRRKKLKETWYNSGGQNGTDKVNERNGSVARKGYGKKEEGDGECTLSRSKTKVIEHSFRHPVLNQNSLQETCTLFSFYDVCCSSLS